MVRALLVALVGLVACAEQDRSVPRADYAADGSLTRTPQDIRRPNVVLVSIDTLRADYLGSYGQTRPTSPALDSLASESVVFERALSCSPWTAPAHVSLMTSLYPGVHGIIEYPQPGVLDERAVTLAEILRAHGWDTAGFTEGAHARGTTGLGDGFDVFPDWPRDGEPDPTRLAENAQRAERWITTELEEPFFLFFHTYEPHYEYRPPNEYVSSVAPDFDPEAEQRRLIRALNAWNAGSELSPKQLGILYRHSLRGALDELPLQRPKRLRERLEDFSKREWRGSASFEEDLEYVRMLYAAEIRYTDEVLANLFDLLRKHSAWDETLVIITSDHGEGLMDHGELQHGSSFFDEVLRVPLIVRFPGRAHAGLRHASQVRSIDVLPTVLDWIGLPVPRSAAGRSLLPLLGRDEPLPSFAEAWLKPKREDDTKALDDGRWKLVRNRKTGQELFFDLESDPGELSDLASAGTPAELETLRAELERQVEQNAAQAAGFEVKAGEFSADDLRELEALGYLGADDEEE